MKKDAKIEDKFKDFKPNLSDRKKIVLGMGVRGFEKLFSLKNKSILVFDWNSVSLDICILFAAR